MALLMQCYPLKTLFGLSTPCTLTISISTWKWGVMLSSVRNRGYFHKWHPAIRFVLERFDPFGADSEETRLILPFQRPSPLLLLPQTSSPLPPTSPPSPPASPPTLPSWWWWCRPHPVPEHTLDLRPPLGARPASPPTRQAAQPPPRGPSTNPRPLV